ncbi:SpoIID/LytB domain-containing protein [Mobilicoccus massiliensis]|uniref:SpoIID/LytB domain-containing protein n=1 Tax=Mobilicoccus massiliensis TaxID=1522310 RepID=UPI0006939795|nr:SpoIID/LytB domain-containing protein [Mobilicoccus massiliensis]
MKPLTLARAAVVPALGFALLAADLGVAPIAAHAADPVTTVPEDGRVTLDGRGYGHGRGMSQWGAYGAADAGLSWPQILSFYYPGATQARQANSEMRVWISRDNDGITNIPKQLELQAIVGRQSYGLPGGPGHGPWRVVPSGKGVALQFMDISGTWQNFRIPATDTVVFTAGDTVEVTMPGGAAEAFPGRVIARREGNKVITIVSTTTERYLRGVVPNEMPSSWHKNAIAAQSVAARTYASAYRARKRAAGAPWDICDTVACQVYRGAASSSQGRRTPLDDARANAAIALTSGTVLKTPGNNFVFAEFSASNGGYTVDGGAFSQVAKPDPYDGRKQTSGGVWTKDVAAATLERQFGLGKLQSLQVVSRDGNGTLGGRVKTVRLVGATRSVDVSGAKLRQVLGLRSEWFAISAADGTTRPGTPGLPATPKPAPTPVGPTTLVAEWSGDRTPDRLRISGGRLVIERGLGRGRYAKAAPVAKSPTRLARLVGVGDVDYDRRADVVAVDTSNRLVVLRGNGKAGVLAARTLGGGWGAFRALELRDVTKDRRADVIATARDGRRTLYVGTAKATVVKKGAYTGR